MKKILFTGLIHNNEEYLPYLDKCFKSVEKYNKDYKIDYLFYTNNNTDNTDAILKSLNYEIIFENLSSDFLDKYKNCRIEKLAILRQKLLEKSKKKDFDYMIIIDTDIFFNGKMVKEAMRIVIEKDLHFTSLNSIINQKIPIHYDWFGRAVTENYNPIHKNIFLAAKTLIWNNNIIETDGFFNGFLIIKNTDFFKKKFNYISQNKNILFCEHQIPNKILMDNGVKINILTGITPIYSERYRFFNLFKTKIGKEKAYQEIYEIVSKEEENLKKTYIFTILLITTIIILYFLVFRLKKIFIK